MEKISFGEMDISDNIIVVEARDGENIDSQKVLAFHEMIGQRLKGNYGLVVNRVHSYSVELPEAYAVVNQVDRLKALAIVTHRRTSEEIVHLDQMFCQKEFKHFVDIDEAKAWVKQVLEKNQ